MDFWQKQTLDKPLFPDLLWSKPQTRRTAGKLLIIGGNLHVFSAPGQAYNIAMQAGVGAARVLLPEGLRKTIGSVLEDCEFAPMNKSGSFAQQALGEWLEQATWADAVLIAGDLGRNSETAIVTEQFLKKFPGLVVITQDALDQFKSQPSDLFGRPQILVVASFGQLQKMWSKLDNQGRSLQYGQSLARNLDVLSSGLEKWPAHLITKLHDDAVVVAGGRVSTTPNTEEIWRVETAAKAAVWWLQNPGHPFEAITTSMLKV